MGRREEPLPSPNWARAAVKSIPYIGGSLDELIYGRGNEARWRRIESLLADLGRQMEALGIPPEAVEREEFGDLLEVVAPAARRTGSEDKRRMLRKVLLNASALETGNPDWEAARLAAELVSDLEPPALAVLAALDRMGTKSTGRIELARDGEMAEVRWNRSPQSEGGPVFRKRIPIPYDWLVVEHAYRRMSVSYPRLVQAGAHGRDVYQGMGLMPLGSLVIRWAGEGDS